MTLSPNTPITQENAHDVPQGTMLRRTDAGWVADTDRPALAKPAPMIAKPGTPPMTLEQIKEIDRCMAATYPEAKPAEGEDAITKRVNAQIVGWERVHGFDMPVAKYATPTPPSVDWSVVGPQYEAALKRIAHPQYGLGFNKLRGIARAALAAAQQEGK